MELMSSAVEVSVAEIRETVRRDRCDWLAAIFNLLIEYPEGRMALQKTLANGEDRGRSLGNSQESLNGTSGFSQGLSQGVDGLRQALTYATSTNTVQTYACTYVQEHAYTYLLTL